jgi:hypothetical protein
MKKLFSVLAALCLVFAVAGNAAADFTYGANSSLALSVFNYDTNVETGYDLGIIGVDFALADQNIVLGNVAIDTGATALLYSTTTAIYGRGKHETFFGLTVEDTPGVVSSQSSANSQMRDVWSVSYLNGASPVTVAASDPKAAGNLLKDTGSYGGLVLGAYPALAPNMGVLATESVMDIFLYHYEGSVLDKGFDSATDYAAVVSIFDNGDVVLNSNPVPVPAAVWLLGSGLLGLIGIRRKNS